MKWNSGIDWRRDVRSSLSSQRGASIEPRQFCHKGTGIAAGIEPELRLARRAGLPVARGVVVDPRTLSCADGRVFALGDCAEVDGRLGCTVEPIGRQARTIAGAIVGRPEPYVARDPVWVVKTPSLPLTIRPVFADARSA
jgi:hypothetical protein